MFRGPVELPFTPCPFLAARKTSFSVATCRACAVRYPCRDTGLARAATTAASLLYANTATPAVAVGLRNAYVQNSDHLKDALRFETFPVTFFWRKRAAVSVY